jgi:molybdopterin synthase catalytic subunit
MKIEIRDIAFDPLQTLSEYQGNLTELQGKFGATASFIGTMRDHNAGDTVRSMTLEHYPGMTERHLRQIVDTARNRWDLIDVLVIHRVGTLEPSDPIVLIAVWSTHRASAFEACRFIMEDLKSKAPFWKRETLSEQERWVEGNTAGYTRGPPDPD